jgi:hypothetical protein
MLAKLEKKVATAHDALGAMFIKQKFGPRVAALLPKDPETGRKLGQVEWERVKRPGQYGPKVLRAGETLHWKVIVPKGRRLKVLAERTASGKVVLHAQAR